MNTDAEKVINNNYLISPPKSHLPTKELNEVPPDFDYSPNLRDFIDIVIRRKWIVLAAIILAVISTWLYNVNQNPVYQAQASLEVNPYASKVTKFQDVSDPFKGDEFTNTQIMLFQSPELARRVAASLHLEMHPLFNPSPAENSDSNGIFYQIKSAVSSFVRNITTTIISWLKTTKPSTGQPDPELMRLIKQKTFESYISANLQVASTGGSNLVSITFDSEDPSLARDIVNELIHEFINWQMERKIQASNSARQQLEKQIMVALDRLEDTEDKLTEFATKQGIVSLDSRLNMVYQQLEQINSALAKVEADRIAKEVNYDQSRNNDLDASPLIQRNTLIEGLRNQYLALLAEYEKLGARYKDEHPTMRSIKAQMREVASRIDAEQMRVLQLVKNEYLATLNTEKALKTTAEAKKGQALKLNELASQYKIIERQVEVNKQIYQSLLERSKEIDANIGTDISNVKIVDLATLPLSPYKPKIPRNLFLALVIGGVFGVGLALVSEHLDDSLKIIDEIPGRYWVPVLGVVPLAQRSEHKNLASLVQFKPSAPFSEAIRIVRVAIQSFSSNSNPVRSLLLTSSTKGEGKSTIAANLAQSLALANEKVLLIEADMRRPSLNEHFNTNDQMRGLSDFLIGTCKYEEIVHKTGMQNLCFISSGQTPSNPSELLMSEKLGILLESARYHFNRIVLDGPPFTSDTLALSSQVDGVILVAALGRTSRSAIKALRKDLVFSGAQLLGCIVNMLNVNRYSREHFYHGYYRRYESSYGSPNRNPLIPTNKL